LKQKLSEKLKKNMRVIPNFPKKGILFQDITSITDNAKLFRQVVKEISKYAVQQKFSKIAAIEARGLIFGTAIAFESKVPLVPIRKSGKLPGKVLKQKYSLEYGNDEIQIHQNAINSKDKILIVDDLIATGGTAAAAAKLISKFKVKKIEFYIIIDLANVGGSESVGKKYKISSLLKTEG
jgi:adenine phosphoribosyltransferase